jgi:hypothetical protein
VDIGTVSPSTGKLYIGSDTQGFYFDSGAATLGNNLGSRNVGLGASANYNQIAAILSSVVLAPGTTWIGTGDGLLKSTDDGLHWTLVNASVTWAANGANSTDPIPSGNNQRPVGRLIMEDDVSGTTSDFLWVGTYKQGVKRSPDQGVTFPTTANMNSAAPGSNYYCRSIAQDPNQHTTIYAGFIEHNDTGGARGFGGLWKCSNAHTTTSTPNFVKQGGLSVAVVEDIKVIGGIIYCACGTDGVYLANVTSDLTLAASWTNIGTQGGTGIGPVLNAGSIWMSLDVVDDGSGHHLVLAACSNPADASLTGVAQITVNKSTFAATARANLATNSSVTTATVAPGGQTWWNSGTGFKLGAANWQNPQVIWDPNDGTHQKMYVVGVSGFYRSTNGGTSWSLASNNMRQFLGRALAIDPNTAGWGAVGSSDWSVLFWKDGVAASASTSVQGGTGIPGSTHTYAIAVDPTDSSIYLGLGNKYGRTPINGQVMTGAGGATWPPGSFSNVAGTPSWATATGSKAPMGLSTFRDGSNNKVLLALAWPAGGLWRNVTSSGTFQGWIQVGAALAVGTSSLTLPGYNARFDIQPGRSAGTLIVYCFDPKTGLYVSSDFGVTWSTVSAAYTSGSANSSEVAAHPLNPGEVWITYNGNLRKFTNADGVGTLGNTLIGTLPHAGAIRFRPTDGLLIATTTDTGTGQLAWQSTDDGNTWSALGGAEFGQLDNTTEHLRFDQAGVSGRIYAAGSNIVEYLAAGVVSGSAFTLVQQSNNLVGATGTLAVWFNGTSVASTANTMLVCRITTDDSAQTITAPAGWELVFDNPSGTTTGQARVLEYVYRNNPGGIGGAVGTAANFTYSNTSSNIRGKLHEWSTPASTFQYVDRVATSSALAASTSLGPSTAAGALRVSGGLAQSMTGTLFSIAPSNTWPSVSGWTSDGSLANAVLDFSMKDQNPPSGTVTLTDSISTSTNMTSWASGFGTFWASPVHVTTASVPNGNVGTPYNQVLVAAGGTPNSTGNGAKVGLTVPTSAFNTGCFAQLNGWATMAVADAACIAKISRYGPGNHPPVTKKFWFTGGGAWNTSLNELSTYRANGTYVIFCMQPTVGLDANYPLGSDYSAGGPVASAATADKTSFASFLTTIAGMGFRSDNCEIVCWQEPGNNISLQQWNNMLRTYGGVVNSSTAADGHPFKLCINIQGHTGSANPTWCKAAMGIGPTYGVGAAKAGLPRIDLMALDYYCSVWKAGITPDTVDSFGDSMSSLADAAVINFALNEVGSNPSAQIPLPANHQTVADSTNYMHYVRDWTIGRQAANVGPRTINWWTANCNADGTGQLSSPIGFQPEWPTNDPRIAPFQEWVDLLSSTGGVASYSWSLWSGTLPPGLAISAGTITGTPTAAGTYTFRVLAVDGVGNMAYSPLYTVVVSGGVQITTTTLPDGAVGELVPYSQTLAFTGGTAPFTWTQPSGSLPTGLSLGGSTGVISGTATVAGTYTFDVQITDTNGSFNRTTLSITIQPAVQITTLTLPPGIVGTSYSFALGASGGLPDYSWAQPSGTLPDQITLDSVTGILAGTPDIAGVSSFQILVTDVGGGSSLANMVMVVAAPATSAVPVDSLVVSGQFELLAGGVVSDHPACPGAIFYLAKPNGQGYDLGMPQPVVDLIASLGLDGERPMGRRSSNRTMVVPVAIKVPASGDEDADRSLLAAAREALWQAIDGDTWELTWARANGLPVVFDCFRAQATTYEYSLPNDRSLVSVMVLTFQALPYGRSNDLETLAFAAPSTQWQPPPDPVTIDTFVQVASANDPDQWDRSTQAATGSFSAHWSRTWRSRPHYTHGLTTSVSIGQRPKVSFWVGLGTSADQYHVWHGGKVTCDLQLTDANGNTIQLAAVVKCSCSGLPGQPSWTRVSMAMPLTTDFDVTSIASYSLKLWNTTDSSTGSRVLQAECYISGFEASAAAVGAPAARGAVYQLRGIIGTARAPLNLQVQPGPATVQQVFQSDSPGSGNWPVPASTTVIKGESWASGSSGGGGDGGSLGGGGGPGGEYACEPIMPVSPGSNVPYTVGAPGSSAPVGSAGNPGQQSTIGNVTGGNTGNTGGGPLTAVIANPGAGGIKGGSHSSMGAAGGTGSLNTIHFDGGNGGPPESSGNARSNGAGGGGSGGQFQAGRDGQACSNKSPGSGGVAVQGGGPGGTGGTGGAPGKAPVSGPGGGSGGGDAQSASGTAAPGRIRITYGVTQGIPLQALVVHRAGPNAPGTLQPLVSVFGSGADVPDGSIEYPVISYAPGVQPAFSGTYTVVAVAQGFAGWASPSSSRTLTIGVKQYDGASGNPPTTGVGRISANSVARTFTPNTDAPNGMIVIGDITLPVRDLAPDQADATFTITVTDSNTSDRFYDVLLLDTEGTTIMLNGTAPGYQNVFIDGPDTDRAIGPVLGSYTDRDAASSILDDTIVSGPPISADPGDNWVLVYAPTGVPGMFASYLPRWWLDRLR